MGRAGRFGAVAAAVVALGAFSAQAAQAPRAAPDGIGAWIDIFDTQVLADPAGTAAALSRRGVETIYVETANYSQPSAIVHPDALSALIDEAHERNIAVVAWYLPGHLDVAADLKRSLAAINFTSAGGDRFDAFALDIEADAEENVELRNRRLAALSRRLRDRVGPDYWLGAIIPSPRGMEHYVPDWWPGFPYRRLARQFDAFLPMGYYSYRVSGFAGAYRYTRQNLEIIRRETGDPSVPIHPIGGLAADTGRAEARGFVRAAADHGAVGASFYDYATSSNEEWRALSRFEELLNER